jgi:N,N'-diacetyllegionaminate synthase
MSILLIAELGVNGGGNEEAYYKLIDAAVDAGADVCKLQLFQPHLFPLEKQEMLKALALPHDAYVRLNKYCDKKKAKFACTAFDADSLDWLLKRTKMPFIKIASPSIHDKKLLEMAAKSKLPIFISTGMAKYEHLVAAEKILRGCNITFLHCISKYPCPLHHAKLKKMIDLKRMMQRDVGISDHSANITVPITAVALGAKVVECHFTLDKKQSGPDHTSSLEPREFAQMVAIIRDMEKIL